MSLKKNSFYLLIISLGSLIASGLGFITHIFIARSVTPEVLGNYSAIFFLTSTLAPLAGFGVSQYLLKTFGQYGWGGLRWVTPTLRFVRISTLSTWLILIILAFTIQKSSNLITAAILMSFIILPNLFTELIGSIFQLEEKYFQLSLWQLTQSILKLFLLAVTTYAFKIEINEIVIAAVFACTAIIMAPFAIIKINQLTKGTLNLKGHSGRPSINTQPSERISSIGVFKESWPFGVSGFFHLVYFQLSIVLINYFLGAEVSGNYSVGFTLITAAAILPGIIYQKFLLPKMHRWAHHDRSLLYRTYIIGNYAMGGIGVLIAATIYTITPLLVEHVFGLKYQKSIEIINYLILVIPIFYVASSAGSTLITGAHMLRKIKYMGITAVISLFATTSLIPLLGVHAGAASLVLSFTILAMLFIRANKKYVFCDLTTAKIYATTSR